MDRGQTSSVLSHESGWDGTADHRVCVKIKISTVIIFWTGMMGFPAEIVSLEENSPKIYGIMKEIFHNYVEGTLPSL